MNVNGSLHVDYDYAITTRRINLEGLAFLGKAYL